MWYNSESEEAEEGGEEREEEREEGEEEGGGASPSGDGGGRSSGDPASGTRGAHARPTPLQGAGHAQALDGLVLREGLPGTGSSSASSGTSSC